MLSALLLAAALLAPQEVTKKKEEPPQEQQGEKEQEPAKEKEKEGQTEPLTYQEVVVVTATRTEEPLVDTVSLVTPFTEKALARSPALVIDDTLRRVPGFSLFRRSSSIYSHPTTQGVSLRGIGPSGASRSLVLWNGIPLNDPFGNWIYFNRLPSLSLRSVEVARGATSQLYGSSALGGTIQLLPRAPEESTLDMRMQGGNLDTYDLDLFASDKAGDWGWIASGRVFGTDGYIQVPEEDRGAVDIPTNAKFQTFLGRLEHRNFHVGVNLFDEKRSNGTPIQQNDSQIYLVETGYDAERWSFNFYGQSQVLDSDFSRIFADRSGEVQTSAQHYPSTGFGSSFTMRTEGGLQWGADWRYAGWEEERQNFLGTFLQYLFTLDGQWDVLVGGRFDLWQNRTTQGTFNPRAGLVFRASDKYTIRASGYRGFRAPSLNELYRPFRLGNVQTDANPDLNEEYLWGAEAGIDIHPNRSLLVRLNGFYNSLQDPIANVTIRETPTTIFRRRQNLGSATIQGLEAEAIYQLAEGFSVRGAYLFSDSVVDETGLALPQTPRSAGMVGFGYDGKFQLTADLRLTGEAFDDFEPPNPEDDRFVLPAYQVLDVSVRVPVASKLDVYFAVENLTDEEYVVRYTPVPNLGPPRVAHGGIELHLFR
jgi:outer membrane receptor protein involved in Fe transport